MNGQIKKNSRVTQHPPAPNIKTFPGDFKVPNPRFVKTKRKDNLHIIQMFDSKQELSISETILANYIGLRLGE